jgi:hypothetical protein
VSGFEPLSGSQAPIRTPATLGSSLLNRPERDALVKTHEHQFLASVDVPVLARGRFSGTRLVWA